MMNTKIVPELTDEEITNYFDLAQSSSRKRIPKILHKKGDYLNKVFNFILADSYMQPHIHPGEEKIEKMYLVKGSFALVIFDDKGNIKDTVVLKLGELEFIEVPAFTWHTYVMLTDEVIVYDTMEGVYHPDTWKKMATWAPEENSPEVFDYLKQLKSRAIQQV